MALNTNTRDGLTRTTNHIKQLIDPIRFLAHESTKAGRAIDPTTDATTASKYEKIDDLLDFLGRIDMTIELRERTNIPRALRVLFACEEYYFPEHYKTRAKTLFDNAPSEPQILMPPRDHPIWGDKAIMAGLAYRKLPSGKLSIVTIPGSARSAKVYGDNGLTVGQWFPSLMAASMAGAHGHNQQGIHYSSTEEPAFSVAISGPEYLEVNDDRWDVVFYCGTGSHENKDPEKIIEANGTKALEASIASGRPVRVLRTSKARSSTPVCGVRYDGLYNVKGSFFRYNKHGGRYLAFELRRLPGQLSRAECLDIPNVHQQTQFNEIKKGYQYQGRFYSGTTREK